MKRGLIFGWCLTASIAYADVPVTSTGTAPAVAFSTAAAPTPPVMVSTPAVTSVPGVSTPAAPATTLPGMKPHSQDTGMNEMSGTVSSIDLDDKDIRLAVDGGFNVDFTYTHGSSFTDNDVAITADDLVYGDKILVRYVGRDLQARQIVRLQKASGAHS